MLARPEVLSAEHILLWLAGKPPQQRYRWIDRATCACGQYWEEYVNAERPGSWSRRGGPALNQLNDIACHHRTFGALHQAYAEAMQARPQLFVAARK
jgi:hypothetical protein